MPKSLNVPLHVVLLTGLKRKLISLFKRPILYTMGKYPVSFRGRLIIALLMITVTRTTYLSQCPRHSADKADLYEAFNKKR